MSEEIQGSVVQLDHQIDVMTRVLASLDAEREALLARDADALESALMAKNKWLTRAAELEQARQSSPTRTDAASEVDADELKRLVGECQAKNAFNGSLIRGQRRMVENTLQWLRGDPDEAGVYGPDGTNPSGIKSRANLTSV